MKASLSLELGLLFLMLGVGVWAVYKAPKYVLKDNASKIEGASALRLDGIAFPAEVERELQPLLMRFQSQRNLITARELLAVGEKHYLYLLIAQLYELLNQPDKAIPSYFSVALLPYYPFEQQQWAAQKVLMLSQKDPSLSEEKRIFCQTLAGSDPPMTMVLQLRKRAEETGSYEAYLYLGILSYRTNQMEKAFDYFMQAYKQKKSDYVLLTYLYLVIPKVFATLRREEILEQLQLFLPKNHPLQEWIKEQGK